MACWHRTAAEFLNGHGGDIAFVSTNSICQGQQVTPLWKPIFEMGYHINFAHRSFVWNTESEHIPNVYCIITSFSQKEWPSKKAWEYTGRGVVESTPAILNGYLADAPTVFIDRRTKPISDVPPMSQGLKPADGGCLLLSSEDRANLLGEEPQAEQWIRRFSMGEEFIKGIDRYCLWLPNITQEELAELPAVSERVEKCRIWRSEQTKTGDAYKLSDRPHLLRPTKKFEEGTYIGVPKVTSERRKYIPLGFVRNGMIPGDKLYFVQSDSLTVFGILMSQTHNAWMRAVAGRLELRYSYANTIVYNNLVFPDTTDLGSRSIEDAAQRVLDARKTYPDASLAELYDPNNENKYPELTAAHQALDKAVERAYGWELDDLTWDEKETFIVSSLFELYSQKVNAE
ncbi:type IIL restriction-modification enzyme MmeI [Corynebacterium kefirresidentii]|uniref:type IIL restriction-modification enzyme MmeI n=1 Tax=Corynebacterium kefirresidentii TaxID=1979527 RepID=UPI0035CD2253